MQIYLFFEIHILITHLLTSGNWLSSPPDVCHPSASSDGTLVKNRGDPERARLIERPSLPRAAPRLPRLPPPSSTLPTAVRAGLRNLHTAFNMGKGKGAPENPALAHAPDSSRAQLTRTDAPFSASGLALPYTVFSSPGGAGQTVRASRSLRDHQPRLLFILLESSWFAQHIRSPIGRHFYFTPQQQDSRSCEVASDVGTEDTVQIRESSRRTSRAWTAPYFEGGGVYTGGADDDGGGW